MRRALYALVVALLIMGASAQARAATILDLTSGTYSNQLGATTLVDTYVEDNFRVQVLAPGNHMDPGLAGDLGFHDDDQNPTVNNDLELSYLPGGLFNMLSINIGAFAFGGTSVDLLGSNGVLLNFNTTGNHATAGLNNVSWVRFSVNGTPPFPTVGFNEIEVDAAVPEPASFTLLALASAGLYLRRKVTGLD